MAHKASTVELGNKILKNLNGMRFPSLLLFILYAICTLFRLVFNSSLGNITDFTLSKLRYFIFTTSSFCHSVLVLVDRALCPAGCPDPSYHL